MESKADPSDVVTMLDVLNEEKGEKLGNFILSFVIKFVFVRFHRPGECSSFWF